MTWAPYQLGRICENHWKPWQSECPNNKQWHRTAVAILAMNDTNYCENHMNLDFSCSSLILGQQVKNGQVDNSILDFVDWDELWWYFETEQCKVWVSNYYLHSNCLEKVRYELIWKVKVFGLIKCWSINDLHPWWRCGVEGHGPDSAVPARSQGHAPCAVCFNRVLQCASSQCYIVLQCASTM